METGVLRVVLEEVLALPGAGWEDWLYAWLYCSWLLVTCPEHFALSILGLGVSCQGVQQSLLWPESYACGCAQFGGRDFGVPGASTTDGARGAVDKSPGVAA